MNIFVLDENPVEAAFMLCDKHVPKMIVESTQMMASALRKHGVSGRHMPRTKAGKAYKGGYHNHPCTVWCGLTSENYGWLAKHALALSLEFERRFEKDHACTNPIFKMAFMSNHIPQGNRTKFAQAMPDEYKNPNAVIAYRSYYRSKEFAKWDKGTPPPDWW